MSENNGNAPSKRVIMAKPQVKEATLIVAPDVQTLLADALSVISTEIIKFKAKTNTGKSLELGEARVLQGYIKALVELSKEARERNDDKDLANMTDEEILQYFELLKAKIGEKK